MATVVDLDAARAQRAAVAEAEGEGLTFRLGGEEFTVLPPKEWPVKTTTLLAKGKVAKAIQLMLADRRAEFRAVNPTLADVEAIMAAVSDWQGLTPGE